MGQCVSCHPEQNSQLEIKPMEEPLEHCANQYLNELYTNIIE